MTPEQAAALGSYLRQHRLALGLSTRELAARSGLDMSAVVRVEQGKILTPGPDKLRKLAHGLGIAAADLFALADYTRPSELPTPALYLRAKYPDLPPEAAEEAERYLLKLMQDHGASGTGPQLGEDET